jgi:hypothetical protein
MGLRASAWMLERGQRILPTALALPLEQAGGNFPLTTLIDNEKTLLTVRRGKIKVGYNVFIQI